MTATSEEQAAGAELTPKQQRFVDAYLGQANFNGAKAARLAGYSEKVAKEIACENLTKPHVKEAIERGMAELAMPPGEVLARLSEQASATVEDFLTLPRGGEWRIDLEKARRRGKLHLVHKLTATKEGPKLELYNAQAALEKLGQHHKLFTERHEYSGPNGGPIPVTTYEVIPPDAPGPGHTDE